MHLQSDTGASPTNQVNSDGCLGDSASSASLCLTPAHWKTVFFFDTLKLTDGKTVFFATLKLTDRKTVFFFATLKHADGKAVFFATVTAGR